MAVVMGAEIMKGFVVFAQTASKTNKITEVVLQRFGCPGLAFSEFCAGRRVMSISRRKADTCRTETRHEVFQRGSERAARA
jgi:hypothetical protein